MASPYSYDLRAKAIKAVKNGEKKINVCRMLAISRNKLNLWLTREKETGDFKAIADYQNCIKAKITDWQAFQEFAQRHGDKTQAQMAQ